MKNPSTPSNGKTPDFQVSFGLVGGCNGFLLQLNGEVHASIYLLYPNLRQRPVEKKQVLCCSWGTIAPLFIVRQIDVQINITDSAQISESILIVVRDKDG